MNDFKNGKYVTELIDEGIENETTEAYNAYEKASEKVRVSRVIFLKPYKEAISKAEADFKCAVDSLPKYPSPDIQALWNKYIDTSHKQGFPVWGMDLTGRENELIKKRSEDKLSIKGGVKQIIGK